MANYDVNAKVREAVLLGRGDPQGAVRALAAMIERDERLLRALVAPFLQGILLHAVQRVMRHLKIAPVVRQQATPKEFPPEALDDLVERLDQKLGGMPSATPKRPPRTPDEALATIGRDPNGPPPPLAGKRHQSALRTLASSFNYGSKPPRG